jgi:hypothetical protein
MSDDIQKKLDELVKQSDLFISSPETIERLKSRGLPIKSVFITFKEYLEKLFTEKRKIADNLIGKLPILDTNIANATIQALYEELKECFVLGIPGAGITLSVILLETGLKYRLFEERSKDDPNSKWEDIEEIDFTRTINDLFSLKVITKKEKEELNDFNLYTRNPYIHYNIKKLVKDMVLQELSSVNIETGEVTKLINVKPSDYPSLWFSAKKALDKKTIVIVTTFCIHWVNKILSKSQI